MNTRKDSSAIFKKDHSLMGQFIFQIIFIGIISFFVHVQFLRAQIRIQDRVEISPQKQMIIDTTCILNNKLPKINGTGKTPKIQSTINLPSRGKVYVEVVDGAAAAQIDLVMRSPDNILLVGDANSHHGFNWRSPTYKAGSNIDIGITWYYCDVTGSEYGVIQTQLDSSTYELDFEDMGIEPWYVDLMVRVTIINTIDHYEVVVKPDTLLAGKSGTVFVQAKDENNVDVTESTDNTILSMWVPDASDNSTDRIVPAPLQKKVKKDKLKVTSIKKTFSDPQAIDGYLCDPGGTEGAEIYNVPYQVANGSGITYVADGDSLYAIRETMVPVGVWDFYGRSGTGTVVVKGISFLTLYTSPDTIAYKRKSHITADLRDQDGNIITPTTPILLNINLTYEGIDYGDIIVSSVVGKDQQEKLKISQSKKTTPKLQDYNGPHGHLVSPDGQEGEQLSNIPFETLRDVGIDYIADGSEFDVTYESQWKLKISAKQPDFPYNRDAKEVFVSTKYDLDVQINPDTLHPGEQAIVSVQKRYKDGTVEAFPPDQLFEVGTVEGCMAGHLVVGGASGNYFKDVMQPFTFVADTTVDSTGTEVKIQVGVNANGGGMLGSVHNKPGDKTKKQDALQLSMKGTSGNPSLGEKKNKIKDGETCGDGQFENSKQGSVNAEVELKPELVVTIPKDEFFIDGTPKMPDLKEITATVKNYKGKVKYHYQLTVKWAPPGSVLDYTQGYGEGKDYYLEADAKDETPLPIDWKTGIRGGDETELSVDAVLEKENKALPTNVQNNKFEILGENPSLSTMLSTLNGTKYEAIARMESNFNHFGYYEPRCNSEPNLPIQGGDPNDIGVMQINKPSDDEVIWNWTANVGCGKNMLNFALGDAAVYHLYYPDSTGTAKDNPLSSQDPYNQQLIEAYCEYNGGYTRWYWDWMPGDPIKDEAGEWVRSNDKVGKNKKQQDKCISSRDYADDVYYNYYLHPDW